MLSTQNLRSKGRTAKFLARFIGPYKIKKVVSPVNYELELPDVLGIHPTFHVNLLKPFLDGSSVFPDRQSSLRPPSQEFLNTGQPAWEVEHILAKRTRGSGRRRHIEYLVKWKGYNEWENTWEPITNLSQAQESIDQLNNKYNNNHHLSPSHHCSYTYFYFYPPLSSLFSAFPLPFALCSNPLPYPHTPIT